MAGHERYERLAVGHVLGGLDEVDAATFRAHLLDCRECRLRVNELREIASDLAATERRERAAVRSSVEVETRTDTDDDTDGRPGAVEVAPARAWPWGVVVLALVPLVVLGTLAWAVWVRAESDVVRSVADAQARVLEVLASGQQVPWESAEQLSGSVATDGGTLAVNLVGLRELRADEGLVLWLLDADGEVVRSTGPYLPSQLSDGALVVALDQPASAARMVISIEDELPMGDGPAGYEMVTAELPGTAPVGDGGG